ncbi:hypothetical protein [Halorubrum sp. AJ67]|uniref:hypothetical protein n=1 Tax=Halorubrum sp. AJ67 TaxID=1173487 RepID=UPI0018964738|nr:hypothetical protein [Halorubrum sp. AJ67]
MSESKYNQADPDIPCGLHFDVDHQQFRFWVDDYGVEIESQPTRSEIRSIAEDLPS